MATKEQIDAARVAQCAVGDIDTLGAIIDAALAVPVDQTAYSDEQLWRTREALQRQLCVSAINDETLRAALAAAGVQPQSDSVPKTYHAQELTFGCGAGRGIRARARRGR